VLHVAGCRVPPPLSESLSFRGRLHGVGERRLVGQGRRAYDGAMSCTCDACVMCCVCSICNPRMYYVCNACLCSRTSTEHYMHCNIYTLMYIHIFPWPLEVRFLRGVSVSRSGLRSAYVGMYIIYIYIGIYMYISRRRLPAYARNEM
jgi:hypothetical protein